MKYLQVKVLKSFKIPKIFKMENVISIFIKNFVNVAMRIDEAFYNISKYSR